MSSPIVEKRKGISPVWILPLLALCVGGWLLFKSYRDAGIDITLRVDTAIGITAGKTPVVFKGGHVGMVKSMAVTDDLEGIMLTIEMDKKTEPFLVEDLLFWVEKVDVEAGRITGLDTLLSGSYIGVQRGTSDKPGRTFTALTRRPPVPDKAPGLHFTLESDALYSVQVGSGIYHRNFMIGSVQSVKLRDDDTVSISAYIQPEFKSLVREGSRFWNASGITVKGGISDLKVHVSSLAAIIKGGIAVATHPSVVDSPAASNGHVFKLFEDFEAAEYGIDVSLQFTTAEGLREDATKIMYRGMEIGHIKKIKINKDKQHSVTASVLLDPRAEIILNSGTKFYLVKPVFSLTGARHLDALLGGSYITFIPGEGESQNHFIVDEEDPGKVFAKDHADGQVVRLVSKELDSVGVGAPILYKKVIVGQITGFGLREKKDDVVITGVVLKKFVHLVKENSRFYNISGVEVTASLDDGFKVQTGSVETIMAGGVSFYTPSPQGKQAKNNNYFRLFSDFDEAESSDRKTITINFNESIGLKKNVKVKYRNIDIGKVSGLRHGKDFKTVTVEAKIDKEAVNLLRSESRFWLVRPEFSLAGTHHLDTLIQGPHIELEPGEGKPATEFTAVSEIAAKTSDEGSLSIVLETDDLFSIKAGSPIFYRRVRVGKVVGFELSPTFQKVELKAVIEEQYKKIIRENSKFWNASGIHVSGGLLSGINVSTESLDSLMTGGIALATPDNDDMGEAVTPGHRFELFIEAKDQWMKWSPNLGPAAPNDKK